MNKKLLKLTAMLMIASASLSAQNLADAVVPTKHNKELTLGELAEIQPGLGTIMMEFGHRFYVAYYAAKAGNWELAQYELKELSEAQETAEATRPKYAKQLKAFEHTAFKKLQDAAAAGKWELFAKRYAETTNACNACHKVNGHPYIQYRLPKEAPKYLRMSL